MLYPKIEKAAVDIWYDNGGSYAGRTEEQMKVEVMAQLAKKYALVQFALFEEELAALTEEEFEEVTCGEQAVVAISDQLDKFLNEILNEIFEAI